MPEHKPRMLIAEDSSIADQLQLLFQDDFDTIVARTGRQAFEIVREASPFDICIIDIIMPVERPGLSLRDADKTGIRLIKEIVRKNKSERILVFTVRDDIEQGVRDAIDAVMNDELRDNWPICHVLLKNDADEESLREAVKKLLTATK